MHKTCESALIIWNVTRANAKHSVLCERKTSLLVHMHACITATAGKAHKKNLGIVKENV